MSVKAPPRVVRLCAALLFMLLVTASPGAEVPVPSPCADGSPEASRASSRLATGERWVVMLERTGAGPVLYFCVDGELRHREEPSPRSTILIEEGTRVLKVRHYPRELLVTLWNQGTRGSSIRIYDPLDLHDPLVLPPATSRSDAIRFWEQDGLLCFEIHKVVYHADREDEVERKVACFPEEE